MKEHLEGCNCMKAVFLILLMPVMACKQLPPEMQEKAKQCRYEALKHASGYDSIDLALNKRAIYDACMEQ